MYLFRALKKKIYRSDDNDTELEDKMNGNNKNIIVHLYFLY